MSYRLRDKLRNAAAVTSAECSPVLSISIFAAISINSLSLNIENTFLQAAFPTSFHAAKMIAGTLEETDFEGSSTETTKSTDPKKQTEQANPSQSEPIRRGA